MGFTVHLKEVAEGTGVIKVNAESYYIEDGAYLFTKPTGGTVASFPVSNVLLIVKDENE